MNKQEMLSKAIVLATQAHYGQFDKAGNPYILHPLKVLHYTKSGEVEVQCIAVMHDIVEDTNVTEDDLRREGFCERIIAGVMALTKRNGEAYEDYKNRVKANRDAILVKMADLRHNSDIRRLKSKGEVTDKDVRRTVKYFNFYLELEEIISPC